MNELSLFVSFLFLVITAILEIIGLIREIRNKNSDKLFCISLITLLIGVLVLPLALIIRFLEVTT